MPGQMVYLFLHVDLPDDAGGVAHQLASSVVYTVYDHDPRLWGITALDDQ